MRNVMMPVLLAATLAGCKGSEPAPSPAPNVTLGESQADSVNTERDPVCGMFVDPKTAPKSNHDGKDYFFCSAEDKAKFDKDPGAFTSQAP